MNHHRRPILIDTDTASDDAVALIMALSSPSVEVKAITIVAGNVTVEQATRNALFTVELCGAEVPVFSGAAKPLERELQIADWVPWTGWFRRSRVRAIRADPSSGGAVDALIEAVQSTPGIEISTLGPLTNLALALQRWPALARSLRRCVVMGGAPCCEGNVTPAAEFNIWVDPEAARIVFASGMPVEMIGWHLSRFDAVLDKSEIQELLALETPLAEFTIHANSTAAVALRSTAEKFWSALEQVVPTKERRFRSFCRLLIDDGFLDTNSPQLNGLRPSQNVQSARKRSRNNNFH
jgi:purine nucleosidase